MKILIADDEAPARSRLHSLLQELDRSVEIAGEAGNGLEALRLCVVAKPDLVLLDIRMPVMDGIDAARELARLPEGPAVIFTTAYNEYALEAFEVSAIDYLLKPVRRDRLVAALEKAQRFTAPRWEMLSASLFSGDKARSRLCVYRHGDVKLIPVADVVYFRAEQKYTTVRTAEGETLIEESLKTLEQEFAAAFVRAHRNALVSLGHIERLQRLPSGAMTLKLHGVPERIEVSRRHLATIRGCLKKLGKAESTIYPEMPVCGEGRQSQSVAARNTDE